MNENPPRPPEDEAVIDADALIADLRKPIFGRCLVWATVVVAGIILLSSVRYLYLCAKYNTMDPRAKIRAIKEKQAEEELEARRQAEREKYAARRKAKTDGKAAPAKEDGTKGGEEDGKSPVEKELEATSSKRPTGTDVSLDGDLDLE
jgi:hypothetical protein